MGSLAKGRYSFWIRVALTLALVVVADRVLWVMNATGLALAILTLAGVVALAIASPGARRHGWPFLALAMALAALQLETLSRLGLLFWSLALAIAALTPRAGFGEGVWTWVQRLIVMATGVVRMPIETLVQFGLKRLKRRPGASLGKAVRTLALPLIGGAVFLALFSAANPLLHDALASLRGPDLGFFQIVLWVFVALTGFALLRPVHLRRPIPMPAARTDTKLPGVNAASITLSLILFNALFALQNGLDVAFLWSGARLPAEHTLAEYAHRGAYPLIATALLAGLFVLVAMAPGSETSRRPLVRWLVAAWVAQNVLLVVFSIQRTLLYIDSFDLTRMRIAALAWMGLVAVGLILIGWRLLSEKSAAWLINMNAAAAAVVLLVFAIGDSGQIAADWNLRHARDLDGSGAALDIGYIDSLEGSALVPLARLEQQALPPAYQQTITRLRWHAMASARARLGRDWSWRDQRRLTEAEAILAAGRPVLRTWRPPVATPPPPPSPTTTVDPVPAPQESRP
ncbi:DUF4173 domain-containing protein [Caulobacter sp. NIBR1757]|uniref:DUF4153 domain-containing protein n=1 Tax=Caulobacter sp. NIBR1757 TaxID=3016000 RepID=UPI0022F04DF2|nr:DUF4173 domain-containing protein [Caulobacter sp. NIBR1757]WGM40895.1 hypothetical protein AMEJIAPC_03842 [Caulobacter sp. NIBR1757]